MTILTWSTNFGAGLSIFSLDFAFNISSHQVNTRYSSPELHKIVIVNRQCGVGESMCVVILGVGVGEPPSQNFSLAKIAIFDHFIDISSINDHKNSGVGTRTP